MYTIASKIVNGKREPVTPLPDDNSGIHFDGTLYNIFETLQEAEDYYAAQNIIIDVQ